LYQPRIYREGMNRERFRFFPSVHLESDLLIGVPPTDYHAKMPETSLKEQVRLYDQLMVHARIHPSFTTSLDPLAIPERAGELPDEITTMYRCGLRTGTGPMSSVAGVFAEAVAKKISTTYGPGEVVVENGGDLHIRNRSELVTVIHAGSSSLSDKFGLVLPPGEWGVCTSSGTLGHSYSMGKADAVTVVCESAPLADAWATALANQVKEREDIEPVLDQAARIREIHTCVVIVGEAIGIRGSFEVKLLS
jgi:ApbE superfamily uncharacterized protein (UPF0280 family)